MTWLVTLLCAGVLLLAPHSAAAQQSIAALLGRVTAEDLGVPYEQILAEAERTDLVVLPRHTRFRFETGEGDDHTLDRVLRQSPTPVVTVP